MFLNSTADPTLLEKTYRYFFIFIFLNIKNAINGTKKSQTVRKTNSKEPGEKWLKCMEAVNT